MPNRFPERGEAPEYNTVDATLWLFVAAGRYLEATGDDGVRARGAPAAPSTTSSSGTARGTRYGIRVDGDGLLSAGEPGVQLTWMDARVGDGSSRRATASRSRSRRSGTTPCASPPRSIAASARRERAAMLGSSPASCDSASRSGFWNASAGALFDVGRRSGPDADLPAEPDLRAVAALSRCSARQGAAVLATVERELLTPRGLRSLAAGDPGYAAALRGRPGGARSAPTTRGRCGAF